MISKYNVGLKTLLSEGLSEPEFYGDLVYKFKKLIGSNDFSFQFRKIITRYRRIDYNLNVMRQSACLVFNPITVDNYAAFFNLHAGGSGVRLYDGPDLKLFILVILIIDEATANVDSRSILAALFSIAVIVSICQ